MIIWIKKWYIAYKALDDNEDIICLSFPNLMDEEAIA